MRLSSKVFDDGGNIPTKFTFDVGEATLPISWEGIPSDTKSLVLVCDDPDADVGTWGHWVLFNIPTSMTHLPERAMDFPEGVRVGKNQLSRREYASTEPRDGMNRYFFSLYALDCELELADGTCKKEILQAIEGHVIDDAQLMGFYEKVSRERKELG